jgi:hypothetical protein
VAHIQKTCETRKVQKAGYAEFPSEESRSLLDQSHPQQLVTQLEEIVVCVNETVIGISYQSIWIVVRGGVCENGVETILRSCFSGGRHGLALVRIAAALELELDLIVVRDGAQTECDRVSQNIKHRYQILLGLATLWGDSWALLGAQDLVKQKHAVGGDHSCGAVAYGGAVFDRGVEIPRRNVRVRVVGL